MPFEWTLSAQVFHEVQTVFRVALYFSTIQFVYAPVILEDLRRNLRFHGLAKHHRKDALPSMRKELKQAKHMSFLLLVGA